MSRVVLNQGAIRDLGKDKALLGTIGDQVASRAAGMAPKDTGAGAASIHAETEVDGTSAVTKVSWDAEHGYMIYHELGTSKMSAHPFLRPALDGSYTS